MQKVLLTAEQRLRRKWYALLLKDSRRPAEQRLVCEEWQDFARFSADVGLPPSSEMCLCLTIAELGYRPGNVRWGTFRERLRNRRHCQQLTHRGKTMSVSEWAREIGICRKAMAERLFRHPVHTALSMPAQPYKRRPSLTFQSKTMSFCSWAQALGISPITLAERIARHSVETALSTPRLPHGGGRPLGRPLHRLKKHKSTRKTFRGLFDHEGSSDGDVNLTLAFRWIEQHSNDIDQLQNEFTEFFGADVAAVVVAYCKSMADSP